MGRIWGESTRLPASTTEWHHPLVNDTISAISSARSAFWRTVGEAVSLGVYAILCSIAAERARIIGQLHNRGSGLAEVLADLEADDDLRLQLELDLLRHG
jgi:hypothetical protein